MLKEFLLENGLSKADVIIIKKYTHTLEHKVEVKGNDIVFQKFDRNFELEWEAWGLQEVLERLALYVEDLIYHAKMKARDSELFWDAAFEKQILTLERHYRRLAILSEYREELY